MFMFSMDYMVKRTLYGGPHDGEVIEVHQDSLKIFPRVTMEDDEGVLTEYGLDNDGEFVWLPDPDSPKVARGMFVFDDDGNLISEEKSVEDVLKKLNDLDGSGE